MFNNVDLPLFPIGSAKVRTFLEPAKCLTYFNTIAYIMPNIDKQLNIFSQLGQRMLIICAYWEIFVSLHTQGDI